MRLTWIQFFSWIWTAPFPCNTIVQPSYEIVEATMAEVLRTDNLEVIARSETVTKLNPMITCVEVIARKWFVSKERVSLLIPNFLENPGLSKAFFTALQKEVATFSVTEDFPTFEAYKKSHNAVIVIRNSTDLNLLSNLNALCGPRCRYVACLETFYTSEADFLAETDAVVKTLWKMAIMNVVIVASVQSKFLIAGTYSFESNSDSVPMKSKILGECSTLATKSDEFMFHKLLMNNSVINITVFDCMPYAKLVQEDDRPVITGIEGNMFESIAKGLNISLNRLRLDSSMNSNESAWDNLLTTLDSSYGSDVAFCGLYWNNSYEIEYSVTFGMEEIVWLVPSLPALSLLGLVTPLQSIVWFAVLGLFIFAGIMKVLLFKKLSFLSVVGLVLGVALPQQPTSLSNRIQFISWVFFGYVITQSYLASMAGQLMNTNSQMIETMEELVNSGISFGGTDRHKHIFNDSCNSISSIIYQRYETLNTTEYNEVMKDLVARRNKSIALVDELEISYPTIRPGPYDPHRLTEILGHIPVAFAVWKGLPYLDQINEKVMWLKQAGLVDYWSEKYINTSSSTVEVEVFGGIDMLHLSPSFLLLLLGQGLSIIVFFIEIGIFVRKNHLRLRRRNKVNKKLI